MQKTITIPIYGMSCEHCVKAVTGALQSVNGVKDITVALADSNATVVYDDALASVSDLEAAITEEGYDVTQ